MESTQNPPSCKKNKLSSHHTAILIMIFCTIFTSTGQLLWKTGFNQADLSTSIMTLLNIPFLLGFLSYAVGAILMLIAFKKGELSILYPIIATSYVWVTLLSPWLFNEHISPLKWAGIILIVISVSVLGFGGHTNSPANKKSSSSPQTKGVHHE